MMIMIISMVDMTSFAQGQLMTFFKIKLSNLTTYSKENHPTKTASAISKKYSSSEYSCKLVCVWCVVGKVVFFIYCCFEAQNHSEDNISLHSLSGALPLIMITQFCISLNLTDIMITQFRIPRMCI